MPTDPDGQNLSFHLSGMIADHRRNLGRVGKIETLQICPRSSQTIGDIYDFQFSLVGKIWDGLETEKSQTVWDFPDICKPGLNEIEIAFETRIVLALILFFVTFLAKTGMGCITDHEEFSVVCLTRAVLRTAIVGFHYLKRSPVPSPMQNR